MIPYDEDLDISIFKKDVNKFWNIAKLIFEKMDLNCVYFDYNIIKNIFLKDDIIQNLL